MNVAKEVTPTPIHLPYMVTTSGPPLPNHFLIFGICVDPPRLSEQVLSIRACISPFCPETSHQIPALPYTNPTNVEDTLNDWNENPGACGVGWVMTAAHSTSGWGSNNQLTFIMYFL